MRYFEMAANKANTMLPNHTRFIEAIRERTMVRIEYYSKPDQGVVNRECAPLDYGAATGNSDAMNLYWIWDYASPSASNPLGLAPEQIVKVDILGRTFDIGALNVSDRAWIIPRDWSTKAGKAPAV